MKKIIHIDMDAFFASVEQRDNPQFRGKPVIVGGTPEQRGVVAACSYEARVFGIHSAMPSGRAIKLCPNAIFLPPRFSAYKECSLQIHAIFKQYTILVEPLSLDEAYLDVTDSKLCDGSATGIAKQIKQRIQNELNLTASAGVSYNKFLAKIASDMDKPNGLYVIRPEQAQNFIDQLPVKKFFGVGKVTQAKMQRLGIFTGNDLKQKSLQALQQHFGKAGAYYYNIVRGVDERPVQTHRQRKSIGKETTFQKDLTDKRQIWLMLQKLSSSVIAMLQEKRLSARTLVLKVRYNNFKRITRSVTLLKPLTNEEEIIAALPALLKKTQVGEVPIRLIGVSLAGLEAFVEAGDERQHANNDSGDIIEQNVLTKNIRDIQMGLFK